MGIGMNVIDAYASYNVDLQERLQSSSGGIFSLLAKWVLGKNGIVYGVAMSEDCYSAEFIGITDENELYRLRGSKYMQAGMGDTYKKVKNDLLSGRSVLFSGTGCQVNGLKCFLKKEYDNLLCVDVICHGVPSPLLWKKYVMYQENRNKGKVIAVNFRAKDKNWSNFGMKEILSDKDDDDTKALYISKDEDKYMQMFLRDYCLRPSCYECAAKRTKMSDLTIAVFWGIETVSPEMNDGKGTSLVLVRTDKGRRAYEEISHNMKQLKVTYEDGVRCNPSEYRSSLKPSVRNTFFPDMKTMDFEELGKKYLAPDKISFLKKVERRIKSSVKKIYKTVWGGGDVSSNDKYGLLFVFHF